MEERAKNLRRTDHNSENPFGHGLKSNNWCTENPNLTSFRILEQIKKCVAKWKDLTKIYKEETDSSMLKEIKLNYTKLHPNNFEKQTVYLVVDIFNARTVAKLEDSEGVEGMQISVQLFTRM